MFRNMLRIVRASIRSFPGFDSQLSGLRFATGYTRSTEKELRRGKYVHIPYGIMAHCRARISPSVSQAQLTRPLSENPHGPYPHTYGDSSWGAPWNGNETSLPHTHTPQEARPRVASHRTRSPSSGMKLPSRPNRPWTGST